MTIYLPNFNREVKIDDNLADFYQQYFPIKESTFELPIVIKQSNGINIDDLSDADLTQICSESLLLKLKAMSMLPELSRMMDNNKFGEMLRENKNFEVNIDDFNNNELTNDLNLVYKTDKSQSQNKRADFEAASIQRKIGAQAFSAAGLLPDRPWKRKGHPVERQKERSVRSKDQEQKEVPGCGHESNNEAKGGAS